MKEEKIIIANWKMKLSLAETINLTKKIKTKFKDVSGVEIAIAPNFISLLEVGAVLKGTNIKLCAQDVFWEDLGAYTGEVSPSMLVEAGCQYVMIGHSERRKFMMGNHEIIVAYEPIWAIGSGTAIEPTEAEYAHKIIKLTLNDMFGMKIVNNNFKIIYGGSINTKNAKGFIDLDNLDGMLVGGASLDVDEFYKLIKVITK